MKSDSACTITCMCFFLSPCMYEKGGKSASAAAAAVAVEADDLKREPGGDL